MRVLGIVWFSFVFGVIQAYDFEDSVYNQILINELDELQWGNNHLLNPRSKRENSDDKCSTPYFRSCCEQDYFQELFQEHKHLKDECYREITGEDPRDAIVHLLKCDKNQDLKRDIACIAECAGRKCGAVDEEGNLLEAEAKKMFKEKASKIEWLSAKSDEIFAKCFAVAQEAAKAPREKGQCNPATIKYGHCRWKEIQASCPEERVDDKAKCKKIRENIDSLEELAK